MGGNYVTFFGKSSKNPSTELIGIALTDQSIADLKKKGAFLQKAERNGHNKDVLILYAPRLNDVMQKVKEYTGKKPDEIKIL